MARAKVIAALLALAALASFIALDLYHSTFSRQGLRWLLELSFPPSGSVLGIALRGLWETMHIAYLGTLLGLGIALPLSLLASRNLFPRRIGIPVRMLLSALRVLPALLWAIIFVMLFGLGPLAGVLAITCYTAGYLGKLFYESFEALPKDTLEALGSMGASRLQLLRFVVIPESAHALLGHALFMFEYNVRHSSVIGIVGAGGIGFYLSAYLKFFEYDKVLTLLLVIFVAVVGIDALSAAARRRFA